MTRSIVFREKARNEFDEVIDFYKSNQVELGEAFIVEVNRVLQLIEANPFTYTIAGRDIRRAVVDRFPFCIYYRVFDDHIAVLALLHARRNQDLWKRRQ